MRNSPIPAAAIGLPLEDAFETTDAGRLYLLLEAIVSRLHVEGTTASFELTPELADDLAAFGAEREDLEQDDPTEEDMPPEESEQLDSGYRLEAYQPVEQRPARRIRPNVTKRKDSLQDFSVRAPHAYSRE